LELGYRRNIAWQKNQKAIQAVAMLIDKFPGHAPFKAIAGQVFASVSSVGANIAEGYSDFEGNEYPRYLKIALRSAYETDHWLATTSLLMQGSKSRLVQLLSEVSSLNNEIIKILNRTIDSIKKKRRGER